MSRQTCRATLPLKGAVKLQSSCMHMQTWRTDHPPKRGVKLLGTRPMVHKGFWRSWSSQGVRDRVFDTIAQIMASQGRLAHSVEVLLTGMYSGILQIKPMSILYMLSDSCALSLA